MSPISFLLIDDHPIFLAGLRHVLESQHDFRVVGEAATVQGAMEQARALRPDVALLDLGLPDGSGLDALPDLLAASPETRVIVLTGQGEEDARPALQLGARGFATKDATSYHVLEAVRSVLRGEIWTAPAAGPSSTWDAHQQARESLTPREREVLRLVVEGKRNAEIARTLVISEHTVRTHVSSLMRKLEIDDRLQLALSSARAGKSPR
jgi:DNA-binding NarL/FixJ family response regulator